MDFKQKCEHLEQLITDSYQNGVTMSQAEMLAGQFLAAQFTVSAELKIASLDARMKKSGVKAIRAEIFLEECAKSEKKPTEGMLTALIDNNADVIQAQNELSIAESESDELERLFSIFQEAHRHFKVIMKGSYGE